jgi:hypothetical protein
MLIKTKKYKLPESLYIKISFKNAVISKWWLFVTVMLTVTFSLIFKIIWLAITLVIGYLLYLAFLYLRFYAITKLEQNKMMFEKFIYEINSQQITIKMSTKHIMPVSWDNVQKVKINKNGVLIIINEAQLLYLPNKIFNNDSEITFIKAIASRKGLIKKN